MDAFWTHWNEVQGNFACPPLGMIEQTIAHIIKYRAEAVLVAPKWEAKLWWPMLLSISREHSALDPGKDLVEGNPGLSEISSAPVHSIQVHRVHGSDFWP
jgi:hypothetical protein